MLLGQGRACGLGLGLVLFMRETQVQREGGGAILLILLMPLCYCLSSLSAESEPVGTDKFMLLPSWLARALLGIAGSAVRGFRPWHPCPPSPVEQGREGWGLR